MPPIPFLPIAVLLATIDLLLEHITPPASNGFLLAVAIAALVCAALALLVELPRR
jgi:hypothetical protein